MKTKLCFIAINIVILAAFSWVMLPGRVFILQGFGPSLELMAQQLAIMEENYHRHEENIARLAYLQTQEGYIIQPAGQVGALLDEIRSMLDLRNLTEQEFYASEQRIHYLNGRFVTETVATIAANGSYSDIGSFVSDLSSHYRFIRLERVQISEEFSPTRLWLVFTIYEEQ